MAQVTSQVTQVSSNPVQRPVWYGEAVGLLSFLKSWTGWEEAFDYLKLHRKGGFTEADLAAWFVSYFASNLRCGIKEFAKQAEAFGRELMHVFGRRDFASQAAVSRALAAVPLGGCRQFVQFVLNGFCRQWPLDSKLCTYRDVQGDEWHVFHLDGRVLPMRLRALPEDESLPPAQRLVTGFASQGYSGRKRSEVQVTTSWLQHSGSGLWLSASMWPGNGELREDLKAAVTTVEDFAGAHGIAPERCIVCIDGVGGGRAQEEVFSDSPIHFITRNSRYELLKNPRFWRGREDDAWEGVEDSLSGPRRFAQEAGTVGVTSDTACRLVVSSYPLADGAKGRGAGVTLDGSHYELFSSDVPVEALPAAELVNVYYGRCGQENRFGQNDREMGLDRVFSYNLGGQLLVTGLGLLVQNLRTILGAHLVKDEQVAIQPQPARQVEEVHLPAPQLPAATRVDPAGAQTDAPEENVEVGPANRCIPTRLLPPGLLSQLFRQDPLDWPSDWVWDDTTEVLVCVENAQLEPRRIKLRRNGEASIEFRGFKGACRVCSRLAQCNPRATNDPRKSLTVRLTRPQSEVLTRPLRADSQPDAEPSAQQPDKPPHPGLQGAPRPGWRPPIHNKTPCPKRLRPPSLVPTELRRRFIDACLALLVVVAAKVAPRPAPPPSHIADGPECRQRRRKTWEKRRAWNALAPDDTVLLRVSTPTLLQDFTNHLFAAPTASSPSSHTTAPNAPLPPHDPSAPP